ncbi:MAG TPA: response regulator, partial [Gemmatimonadales bacterium]|nr:response regulator [Gemmatimonadales bacterium]
LDAGYCRHHDAVQPGPYVVISVADNGCGMDAATQARIFEPFFTTKEIGKGTGLGLSTVYGIVKQSGGFIWVYSEPGRGSTFKVYFPRVVARADTLVPAATVTEPIPGGSETILLVEDDPTLRELTQHFLHEAGYTVLLAENPAQALEAASASEASIHLLLTDFVMPGMNGVQLASKIGAIRPDLKLLVMSGYASDQMAQRGDWCPGSNFLEKPFSRNELLAQVYKTLHHR